MFHTAALSKEGATHMFSILDGFSKHLKWKSRLVITIDKNLRHVGPCWPSQPHLIAASPLAVWDPDISAFLFLDYTKVILDSIGTCHPFYL